MPVKTYKELRKLVLENGPLAVSESDISQSATGLMIHGHDDDRGYCDNLLIKIVDNSYVLRVSAFTGDAPDWGEAAGFSEYEPMRRWVYGL